MLFSSFDFLFLFLPLTLVFYFLSPEKIKNYVLLIFSCIFYGISQPSLLLLLLFCSLFNFFFGAFVFKAMENKRIKAANALVFFCVAANVSVLFVFKYLDPLCLFLGTSGFNITLPVGISFYTFQAMSYVLDVRRGISGVQKNPFLFLMYVTLFPQLVAGPIVRYSDIERQIEKRRHSTENIAQGARRFCIGLAKKVILANSSGEMWERFALFSKATPTVLGAYMGIVSFAFQIYFDFSGYSDMAIGLGKIFGFSFPENFNYPYISKSITEFWRRWHITLSSFFREYVYFPLGGSKRGIRRTYLNLCVVWILTGIWHGSSLNFLLWGIYFLIILIIEKAFLLKALERLPNFLRHLYACILILVGWLIFTCDGERDLYFCLQYLKQMLFFSVPLYNNDALFELTRNIWLFIIMAIASTPIAKYLKEKLPPIQNSQLLARIAQNLFCFVLFIISLCYIADSSYNPFLYFRF